MNSEKEDKNAERVSEEPAAYGKRKRFQGNRIPRTQADRDAMDEPPLPAEPDFVAEILAEAERRKREREKK